MEDLPYRQSVNAFIINEGSELLLIQKVNYDDHHWEVPGGGLNYNESPESCVLRELKEELGTNKFEILKKSNILYRFEWPQADRDWAFKKHGIRWRGQEKSQYLLNFLGNNSDIILDPGELKDYKWVKLQDLIKYLVFEGQFENHKKVLFDFGYEIN
ncbi:protein containing NUDIX hydrolase, core domain [sediment metagenome]|uniref:Protein containing NUDIX hydrolase, core domain n=1 Tax=sediment metagenome TaxID=749907 RepID=D9PJS2_9ZZZZ